MSVIVPKYKKVHQAIKGEIEGNVYQANDMLASGEELAKKYDCSVLTIKKALDKLVSEGFIVRKRGLGTFVKKIVSSNEVKNPKDIQIFKRDLLRPGITSHVVRFEVMKADEILSKRLNIEPNEFVYYIERIRLYDLEAKVVEYTWMPINVIKGLQLADVEASIYYYITKKLHLKIQSAHVSIHALRPNALEKEYLHLQDSDFVCEMIQTGYLDDSTIFEYSIAHSIPEGFEFETTVITELY